MALSTHITQPTNTIVLIDIFEKYGKYITFSIVLNNTVPPSKIFINGLKQIDINDRPVHCSDSKRETIYIKNNDQWNKEDENKSLLTNAIKHVAHKNMKQITEWTKEHPEYNNSESKQNDKYLKIVCESMSGGTQEETNKNYNKIIKNIAKETIINK